jgi:hypothetical protein
VVVEDTRFHFPKKKPKAAGASAPSCSLLPQPHPSSPPPPPSRKDTHEVANSNSTAALVCLVLFSLVYFPILFSFFHYL